MSDLTDRLRCMAADSIGSAAADEIDRLTAEVLSLQETVKRKDQIIVSQGHLIKMYQTKVKQLDGFNGGMGN